MTLALLIVYLALLLLYAGVKGKSVQKLLVGDNSAAAANPSVAS